jgi:uncharacterized repeat protein (TIGR03803 family)
VFKISTNGALTSLYSFTGTNDGGWPVAGLVQGSDGYFYGTTEAGGTPADFYVYGTVFKISTNGVLTPLWSFGNIPPYGGDPEAGLVLGSDGNFYGTTDGQYDGTVFSISSNGSFTNLYSFGGGYDGANPTAGLIQGKDGNFYGTTEAGGTNGYVQYGSFFSYGTVFQIDTNGVLTTLHEFGSVTNAAGYVLDGTNPRAGLVQGSDGSFYGTTYRGGSQGGGTIFRMTIVPEPPQLTITPAGANVILSWPTGATGFNLEFATSLVQPVVWQLNSTAPLVVSGQNIVTIPMSGSQMFFRLTQ